MLPTYVASALNKVTLQTGACCMVYTELAQRWQQFHMAPAMQQPNSAVSTPLRWILENML